MAGFDPNLAALLRKEGFVPPPCPGEKWMTHSASPACVPSRAQVGHKGIFGHRIPLRNCGQPLFQATAADPSGEQLAEALPPPP